MAVIYNLNDNTVVVDLFTEWLTKDKITDASFEFSLYTGSDYTGNVTGAVDLPLTLYDASVPRYYAHIPGTISVTNGTVYYYEIVETGTYADRFNERGKVTVRER